MDEFTLVDSVGDIDENENEDSDEKGEDTINPDINVGAEHVKRVEAFYCDLCHYYLPMNKDPEEALKKHCNIRSHLKNYLRHQEDQSLRLCAEKIHRRHQGEKGRTVIKPFFMQQKITNDISQYIRGRYYRR